MIENSVAPQPEKLAILPEIKDSFSIIRDPNLILKEAMRAATALKKVIDAKPHKIILNGEIYLENEDWLTIARFYGITSRVRSTNYVKFGDEEYSSHGFEAIAEAYLVQNDQVISMAESMCLSDESNWKNKPLFQLRSMAQTRASRRVLRQVLGWVVVLAGYKPTPAEEMIERGGNFTPGTMRRLRGRHPGRIRNLRQQEKVRAKTVQDLSTRSREERTSGANRNLEPELRQSIERVRNRRSMGNRAPNPK